MRHIDSKYWIILSILLLSIKAGYSNDPEIKKTGVPFIQHYSKRDYKAGTQNWTFVQANNGILYIGNNLGILKYDGTLWDIIPLPNHSVVRCLFQDNDGTIYAGGFNEFGYLKPDESGKLIYHSLNDNIPAEEPREFWRIARSGDFLYFQSYEALVVWNTKNNEWTYLEAENQFGFINEVDGKLILNDQGRGLVEISGIDLISCGGGDFFARNEVWKIIRLESKILVCTQNEGIFEFAQGCTKPWDTEINIQMIENRLFSVEVGDDHVFWGSILNGLYITDMEGRIIQNLNKERGLHNNTILSIFLDYESNIWLGLDNGIDLVDIYSPLSNLFVGADIGSGYSVAQFKDRIYLGTNQGLFWVSDYRKSFNSIGDSQIHSVHELSGQVWSLHVAGDYLLVGHNRGTFAIDGDIVEQIGNSRGGWNFEPVPNHPELILQGTYDGLQLFEITKNGITLSHIIDGYSESGKMLLFESEDRLWVGHGYKGIFRLDLNADFTSVNELKLFGESSGLGSNIFNELLTVTPEVLVCNEDGFFIFDEKSNDFIDADLWNENFPKYGRMTRLIRENDETYWFFQDRQAGKLRIFNDTLFVKDSRILSPLVESFSPSFENIFFMSDRDLIFGTNDGYVHLDPQIKLPNVPDLPIIFSLFVSLRSDSALHIYLQNLDQPDIKSEQHPLAQIPYRDNDIRVSFVAPSLMASDRIQYQYILDGQSLEWSHWAEQSFAEFTNMREGEYLLRVKARNAYGVLSSERSLFFHIKTPWYRSILAKISYFLLVILFIFLSWYLINKRLEREKRRAMILEKRKMLHKQLQLKRDSELAEKEIVKLRNDKLRADIRHKSKQLANQTMDVLQKNRFLTDIKLEMIELKKRAQSEEVKSSMRRMIRKIDRNIEDEDTLKVFETSFDQVHENFLRRLREAYPELTAKDLRLCAYLRLNLSSKEIAPLLNISIRGVEISRYRLRKKLNLHHEEHLADFILAF